MRGCRRSLPCPAGRPATGGALEVRTLDAPAAIGAQNGETERRHQPSGANAERHIRCTGAGGSEVTRVRRSGDGFANPEPSFGASARPRGIDGAVVQIRAIWGRWLDERAS